MSRNTRIELGQQVLPAGDFPAASHAQPLGRILGLTIDDIDTTGSDVLLRLGDPPTPVPEPVADLLPALRDQRTNLRTATNRNARSLFPGRRAGQPLTTRTIGPLIRDLGVFTLPAAWQHCTNLSSKAPAPIIAQALGFHHTTTSAITPLLVEPGTAAPAGTGNRSQRDPQQDRPP